MLGYFLRRDWSKIPNNWAVNDAHIFGTASHTKSDSAKQWTRTSPSPLLRESSLSSHSMVPTATLNSDAKQRCCQQPSGDFPQRLASSGDLPVKDGIFQGLFMVTSWPGPWECSDQLYGWFTHRQIPLGLGVGTGLRAECQTTHGKHNCPLESTPDPSLI